MQKPLHEKRILGRPRNKFPSVRKTLTLKSHIFQSLQAELKESNKQSSCDILLPQVGFARLRRNLKIGIPPEKGKWIDPLKLKNDIPDKRVNWAFPGDLFDVLTTEFEKKNNELSNVKIIFSKYICSLLDE
jgi:hypothetical protein